MAKADRQHSPVVFDTGPPERRQHNRVVLEQTANHRARLRVVDQTELDRLLLQRKINMDQHTAGEHLFRDVQAAGYMPQCKWAMDANIRGAVQTISQNRADALLRIGLGRAWLLAKSGRRTTEYLFGVVLGERKAPDSLVPSIRMGLDTYQRFESWWHDKDIRQPLPALLAELPGKVKRTQPFHHQMR